MWKKVEYYPQILNYYKTKYRKRVVKCQNFAVFQVKSAVDKYRAGCYIVNRFNNFVIKFNKQKQLFHEIYQGSGVL